MATLKASHCQECTRPISLHFAGQRELCTECARRLQAMTEANAAPDAGSRRAALEYAQMMRLAAWRLGGRFDDLVPLDIDAIRVPAYMSERAPGGPKAKRPRGRPALHPSDRLVPIGMRVPPPVREKLKRLGRGWLVAKVMAAKQSAQSPSEDQ